MGDDCGVFEDLVAVGVIEVTVGVDEVDEIVVLESLFDDLSVFFCESRRNAGIDNDNTLIRIYRCYHIRVNLAALNEQNLIADAFGNNVPFKGLRWTAGEEREKRGCDENY
jgi:hypothetical protein